MKRLQLLIILSLLSNVSLLCQIVDGEKISAKKLRHRLNELQIEEKQLSDSVAVLTERIEADRLQIISIDSSIVEVEAQIALLAAQKPKNEARLARLNALKAEDIAMFVEDNKEYVTVPLSKTEQSVLDAVVSKCDAYHSDAASLDSLKQAFISRAKTYSAYKEIRSVSEMPYDSLAVRKALVDLDNLLVAAEDSDREDIFILKGYLVNYSSENSEFDAFVKNINSKLRHYRTIDNPDEELVVRTAMILMDIFKEKTILTVPFLCEQYSKLSEDLTSAPLIIGPVEQSIAGEE